MRTMQQLFDAKKTGKQTIQEVNIYKWKSY